MVKTKKGVKKKSGLAVALKIIEGQVQVRYQAKDCNISDLALGVSYLEMIKNRILSDISKSTNIREGDEPF